MKHWDVIIELLSDRNHAVCAEIGVWKGDFAIKLLAHLPGIRSYQCVDPWVEFDGASAAQRGRFKGAYSMCMKQLEKFQHKVDVLRMTSKQAAPLFEPNYFDFVYIDAYHVREAVKEDIQLWLPKVKPGGILAGHDYIKRKFFGVIEAVDELLPNAQIKDHVWWIERN